ncbi:MAG: hypothetical protein AAB855_02300 [Patescibacteria group bacterium]
MTIELTPAQYASLLKLVYLGEWMTNGIRVEEERDERAHQAAQHFYSYAQEAGAANLVEYDKELRQYLPTQQLDEDSDVERFREEYDAEIFWDELIERLAMRDFMSVYGDQQWLGGSTPETGELQGGFIEKYAREFEEHGVDNLVLKGE